ncbi:MAG: DNA methyltransferase [Desulfatiglandaceae bacterium]
MKLSHIPINQIEIGPRIRIPGNVTDLAESIKANGQQQPITVLDLSIQKEDVLGWPTDMPYLLLAGRRRLEACRLAKVDVLAVIREEPVSQVEVWQVELIENLHRKDLEWHEDIALKKKIHDKQVETYGEKKTGGKGVGGWSKRDTARMLGESHGNLADDLALAEVIEKIPTLAEADSKKEARKLMVITGETVHRRVIAKEIEQVRAKTPATRLHQQLIKSFILMKATKDLTRCGFFEGVKDIPDNSIDLVEIDPPYGIDLHEVKKDQSGIGATEGYNEIDKGIYLPFLDRTLKEAYRITKDGGWVLLWFGPEPWFQSAFDALRRAKLKTRRIPALWAKSAGQTLAPDIYMANCYEPFYYARKGDAKLVKKGRSNVFNFAPVPPSRKTHPTERPVELMEEILEVFCEPGAKICVPFLGSGNTVLAAHNLKMQAFGWELTQEYKDSFVVKVAGVSPPGNYRSYGR